MDSGPPGTTEPAVSPEPDGEPISQGQVDAYQSAPGYFDGRGCSVAATITSNFAQAHG